MLHRVRGLKYRVVNIYMDLLRDTLVTYDLDTHKPARSIDCSSNVQVKELNMAGCLLEGIRC